MRRSILVPVNQASRRTMQLVAEIFLCSARSNTAELMPALMPKSSAQMQR
jgi:hypothetical protein